MKKLVYVLVLTVMFVMGTVIVSNAATLTKDLNGVCTVKNVSVEDFSRFAEVVTKVTGKEAEIVNLTNYSDNTWIVRVKVNDSRWDTATADYAVTIYPYFYDNAGDKEYSTLPFKSVEEGKRLYGPSWFYFGMFDDKTGTECGVAVAERLNRWPADDDVNFSSVTYSGKVFTGSYKMTNKMFLSSNR